MLAFEESKRRNKPKFGRSIVKAIKLHTVDTTSSPVVSVSRVLPHLNVIWVAFTTRNREAAASGCGASRGYHLRRGV